MWAEGYLHWDNIWSVQRKGKTQLSPDFWLGQLGAILLNQGKIGFNGEDAEFKFGQIES